MSGQARISHPSFMTEPQIVERLVPAHMLTRSLLARPLNRNPNRKLDRYSDQEIKEAGKVAARSLGEERKLTLSGEKLTFSGKKGKPSIEKLMASNGGRLQKQRAKHQTGNPRFS